MADAFRRDAIRKSYGGRPVLDGLNLAVEEGQAVGLLGANGAGKTTLLSLLLGLTPMDGGRALINAEPAALLSMESRARLGYVPQIPSQFAWLTGRAMLRYIAAFYPRWDWAYTNDLTDRWKVSLKTPIVALSPGQQQRLSIVRALGPRPAFVVLDEPIAALDPATRIAVIEELLNERRLRSVSIIFSSHITGDLERLCDRFVVIAAGRVAFDEGIERCRDLVRVTVSGGEDHLRATSFAEYDHVRVSRTGERVLVSDRNRASQLNSRLPPGLTATIDASDLESVLSEWMQ